MHCACYFDFRLSLILFLLFLCPFLKVLERSHFYGGHQRVTALSPTTTTTTTTATTTTTTY